MLITPTPIVFVGRSVICLEAYVVAICAVVVSISAAAVLTSTVVEIEPRLKVILTVAVWFNCTGTPFIS